MNNNDDAMDQSQVEVYAKRRKVGLKRSASAGPGPQRGVRVVKAARKQRAKLSTVVRQIIAADKEDKWISIHVASASATTAPTIFAISSTLQIGDEHYNREGEKVKFNSIIWSGRCDCADYDNVIRWGLIEFDQNSGNALTGPDFYDSALFTTGFIGTYLLPQDKNMKGETGLYDRARWVTGPHTMALQLAGQATVTDTATRHANAFFNGKAKLNFSSTWNTADVCMGKVLYLVYWSDSGAVTHPSFSINARLFFQDM